MMLTQARAIELFDYEHATGRLLWKVQKASWLPAGSEAGTATRGYRSVKVDQKRYPAHWIVWLLAYGSFPAVMLDHKNGNPSDNRLENLRPADHSENGRNRGAQSNCRSGFKGVIRSKNRKKWLARIGVRGKYKDLGTFETAEDAAAAYAKEAARLHGEFARIA